MLAWWVVENGAQSGDVEVIPQIPKWVPLVHQKRECSIPHLNLSFRGDLLQILKWVAT